MNEEYRAIVDAGNVLQIDDAGVATKWDCSCRTTASRLPQVAEVQVELVNDGLRGVPEDRVRLHVCWGSFHHPHTDDIAAARPPRPHPR